MSKARSEDNKKLALPSSITVSQLREYQKILNEEPMDVLGSQSPFEVFYGRETNAVTQRFPGGFCCKEGSSSKSANVLPNDNDFTKQ